VHGSAWSKDLRVEVDGHGVVSHTGSAVLRLLADNTGLTAGLSRALALVGGGGGLGDAGRSRHLLGRAITGSFPVPLDQDQKPPENRGNLILSLSHNRLGNLAVAVGDTTTADQHYRAALTIRERLAAADPANAGYQRDLAYAQQRLAALREPDETR
jgi:hypothetical protein